MSELRRETATPVPEVERVGSTSSLHASSYRTFPHAVPTDRLQRDIKSPIAVAHQKQATKLGLPPNTTEDVLPKIKPSTDTSISPTKANTLQPARSGDEGQTPNGGAFPELPSPGFREGDGSRSAGVAGTLIDKEGNVTIVTYAVAIYPYVHAVSSKRPSDRTQVYRRSTGRV